MQFSDHYWVASSVEQTWNALHDPQLLKQCIRGCKRLERLNESEYKIVMEARPEGVPTFYEGHILLSERQPPNKVHVAFESTDKHAGLVIGSADIHIEPVRQGGSRLGYSLHVATGGDLARLGDASLRKFAIRHLERFFARFADHMATNAKAYSPPAPPPSTATPQTAARAATLRSWLILLGLVVLIAAYYVFIRE